MTAPVGAIFGQVLTVAFSAGIDFCFNDHGYLFSNQDLK